MNSKPVLEAPDIERALTRLAHEITERNGGKEPLVLCGIRTRGVYLAERLYQQIQKISKKEVTLGILDITLYRDDLSEIGARASIKETIIPVDLTDRIVVLVDDVLYTGRTIRAALDAITDFGRPQAIQLAVLVDRGHRELPIKADYVGKNIPTAEDEVVTVLLQEIDGTDQVVLRKQEKS